MGNEKLPLTERGTNGKQSYMLPSDDNIGRGENGQARGMARDP